MSKSWDSVLAWMKDQEQINHELLNAVNELASRIIVETSPTAPTPVGPWDAEACTTRTDSPLQSGTAGAPSGLAEQSSECAHQFVVMRYNMDFEICSKCRNVWKFDGQILVPVAATDSSTSAKPLSPSFAANSHEGSAPPTSAPSHEGGNP